MKALTIIGLLFSLVLGISLAVSYKELVAITGSMGFVLAALGGVMTLLSIVIMMIKTFKTIKHNIIIR